MNLNKNNDANYEKLNNEQRITMNKKIKDNNYLVQENVTISNLLKKEKKKRNELKDIINN